MPEGNGDISVEKISFLLHWQRVDETEKNEVKNAR